MPDLLSEVRNLLLFVRCVLVVLVVTGLGAGALIALGYEVASKRRAL
jgi:hypothetical protein